MPVVLLALLLACGPADDSAGTGSTLPGSPLTGPSTGQTTSGVATGSPSTTDPVLLPAPTWEVTGAWSAWSSPQLIDLDGDGVLDVVTGHGSDAPADPLETLGEARAHSGVDGSLIWQVPARQELFTSAVFAELGGTVGPDVVIGGRHSELMAIDGLTAEVLWAWPMDVIEARSAGWYNFYTPAVVGDLDGDGVVELLLANGGDALAPPNSPRPAGQLTLLSGATGAVQSRAAMPYGAETYCSPRYDGTTVYFGTGGETQAGGLYRATLDQIYAGELTELLPMVDGAPKGQIGPAALADLDGDGVQDPVVATYGGSVVAVSGATSAVLWRLDLPGHETHGMPVLAQLNGDGVADVVVSLNQGVFPAFTGMTHLALDGATGAELWRGSAGVFGTSGGVAVDRDGDGLDEVIFGVNHGMLGGVLNWQPYQLNPSDWSFTEIAPPFARSGVSAPWVGDLDEDGLLELVLLTADLGEGSTWRLARYDLEDSVPPTLTTPHYLGGSAAESP